jgi:hypothetical protein
MKSIRYVLNPLMVYGAVLGWIIFGAVGRLQEAWRHQGAGYVSHEGGESERVSETKYKRRNYTEGGFMLILGVFLWVCVAKYAESKDRLQSPPSPKESI